MLLEIYTSFCQQNEAALLEAAAQAEHAPSEDEQSRLQITESPHESPQTSVTH